MEDLKKYIDQPITSAAADYLGHNDFAKKIAKMYAEWSDDKSSLVTALYGDWGSGKTSVKNLIINEIKEKNSKKDNFFCWLLKRVFNKGNRNRESIIIIEFNPWEWASQDSIIDSFYGKLIEQLDHQGRSAKKIAKIIKNIQKGASFGSKILDFLMSGKIKFPAIAIFSAYILGVSVDFVENVNLLGSLLPFWIKIASIGVSVIIIILNLVAHFFPNIKKTHQQLKTDLTNLLIKRKTPLIIVLDDLDRLPLEQLKIVIQLVKVNMDFPNTIFMLLYQKDIVEKMLTNDYQEGSEYMKKIIQLPLIMPNDTTGKIRGLLSDALYPYLGKSERNNTFVKEIYSDIFVHFETVRDVKRFLISFKFNLGALKGDNHKLFLDPLDFFILETLRIYDSKLFNIISINKQSLTNLLWSKSSSNSNKILDEYTDHREKEKNMKILNFLFTKQSDSQAQSSVNRIYKQDVFENYFALKSYALPTLNINKIKNMDANELMRLYNDWRDVERDSDFVEYLERNVDSLEKENINEYLSFLLKISDQLTKRVNTVIATEALLFSLFSKLLMMLDEPQRREFFLSEINIQEKQYGFLLVSYVLGLQADDKESYFNIEDFGSIKKQYCKKIVGSLSKGSSYFFSNQNLYTLLLHLDKIYPKKRELIKSYIIRFIKVDSRSVLIILKGFVRSYITSGPDFSGVKYYINQRDLEYFVSLSTIYNAISNLDNSSLNEGDREIVGMYHENHEGFP